ncbi:hypothetical protein KIL84_016396 [Mauremys mutica]|uniref:Uncharacterized protein n=1 Tax=Mauremys mutica TaxID=74926 RepID=A0A9D4AQP6_9SAUR|nr:hypothetical protein KIL84_016396 [Mauremys mutica]
MKGTKKELLNSLSEEVAKFEKKKNHKEDPQNNELLHTLITSNYTYHQCMSARIEFMLNKVNQRRYEWGHKAGTLLAKKKIIMASSNSTISYLLQDNSLSVLEPDKIN